MARKTHFAGIAAIAATMAVTFASAEISGANAQQALENEMDDSQPTAVTDEVVPVFIANEVVQPLPEEELPKQDSSTTASSLKELVSSVNTSETLSREMRCLAGTVYFESRGEPLAGQLAVAQVVINRSESRRFPSSYCAVVHQPAQFSFVKNGQMPRIRTGSKAWERAKAIARIAHEGAWKSEAHDALYFHAKYVRPSWSRKKTARATISTHIFYR